MPKSPDVLLLIGPGCPHCAAVLQHLQDLIKQGRIGELRVIHIAERPQIATELGVRAVPWLRIADFELEGAHTLGELREWIERAGREHGIAEYFLDLLAHGQRGKLLKHLAGHPAHAGELFHLLGAAEATIDQRVGVGSILEELAEQGLLGDWLAPLTELAANSNPTIRADALHYLAMTASEEARTPLLAAARDDHEMVREVAAEALAELDEALAGRS